MAAPCVGPQALALRPPSPERGHVGLDPGLVDEHQLGRTEAKLKSVPALALAGDVGPRLLKRERRFLRTAALGGAGTASPCRARPSHHARPTRPSARAGSGGRRVIRPAMNVRCGRIGHRAGSSAEMRALLLGDAPAVEASRIPGRRTGPMSFGPERRVGGGLHRAAADRSRDEGPTRPTRHRPSPVSTRFASGNGLCLIGAIASSHSWRWWRDVAASFRPRLPHPAAPGPRERTRKKSGLRQRPRWPCRGPRRSRRSAPAR